MKIEKLNEDNFIVFLNKFYLKRNQFELKGNFQDCFKNLFKILNKFYDIELIGYYDIKIYCDKIYGYILDIKKENLEFYDYYDDHIDMKIEINNNQKFIYKLHNKSVLNESILYFCYISKVKDSIYLIPKKTINQYCLGNIIENSTVIYGTLADTIISKFEDVKTNQIFV